MQSFRLLVASTLSLGVGAVATACGDGGGFRAAAVTTTGGTSAAAAGAAGMNAAGAGGATAGGVGGDASGGGQAGFAAAGAGGDASAGQAGSSAAGSGTFGGAAGEANGGTNAGMSGTTVGGSAGIGGATSGGAGGSGGSGVSGASGTNATGGVGGSGGASTGGSAGAGGPLHVCAERCNGDADCRIFSVDQGYRCNTTAHRCERFAEPCRTSVECLPGSSFWIFDCRSDADCFFFDDDVCIDAGGVGRCARRAPSANGCGDSNPDEVTLPRFGTSGNALVCANASRTCSAGACVAGCATSADCTPERNGSVCDTSSGLCRCVSDQDCGGAGVSHCNASSGRCECTDSRDCDEVPNSNACLAGRCGCSGVSACNVERTFSGTTYVCE